jgi:hypothetical protein
MAVGSGNFKKALQLWASGVAVVTSHSEIWSARHDSDGVFQRFRRTATNFSMC